MNSLAAFRSDTQSNDLARLAEQHIQHDLNEEDRQALKKASGKVSKYASIGTFVGLAAGVAAAFRLRRARADFLGAIRAAEKPTQVVFADGRTGNGFPLQLTPHVPCPLSTSRVVRFGSRSDRIDP